MRILLFVVCLFSTSIVSADVQKFTAKINMALVFHEYENQDFSNKVMIYFDSSHISLAGCETDRVIISTDDSSSNGSELFGTILAAMMSGKSVYVRVRNDTAPISGYCDVTWLTVLP